MSVVFWTLFSLFGGGIIYYLTDWVEFGVFVYTCFIAVGLVTLFSCTTSREEKEEQTSQGQNIRQLLSVFFFFLCTIIGVFVISVWAIYAGITTSELNQNVKSDGNASAHTIVIANALIWTFAMLSLLIYVFSQIGFKISELAHKGIANGVLYNIHNKTIATEHSTTVLFNNDANINFIY
jgi:NADH:ubiquinone oxidoreductase subunit 6 (subunit J)